MKKNRIFHVALLPALLFGVIFLHHPWIPNHDTLNTLHFLHYFFSHYSLQDHFPLWTPYQNWGKDLPLLSLLHVSPTNYFLFPIIHIFKLNIANYFYLCMVFEEIIFLSGCFFLGKTLFKHWASILFMCISLGGTALWFSQIHFNFRFYYFVPLVLYFFLKSVRKRTINDSLIGFNVIVLSSLYGNSFYHGVIAASFCVGILLFEFKRSHISWKEYRKSFNQLSIFLFLNLLVLSILAPLLVWLSPLPHLLTPRRAPDGLSSYTDFLTYGEGSSIFQFSEILTGLVLGRDTSVFAGILTPPLALAFFF